MMTRRCAIVTLATFPDLSGRFLKNGQLMREMVSKIKGEVGRP
ncbi:Hypothetical protein ABZS17G119_04080 [Kosakonia cowanii]